MFIGNSLGAFNIVKQQAKQISISNKTDNNGVFRMDSLMKKQSSPEKIKTKLARIRAKLTFGKKLTTDEMEFLRQNDQQLYLKAVKIEMSRQMLKEQVKNSETKEQVQQAIANQMSSVRGTSEDMQMEQAAIADESSKVVKSSAYNKLPATKEELNKEKNIKKESINNEDITEQQDTKVNNKFDRVYNTEYTSTDEEDEFKDFNTIYTRKKKHKELMNTNSKFVRKI